METKLEKIKCMICGKETSLITSTHLHMHNTTVAEYKINFPEAPLSGSSFRGNVGKSMRKINKNDDTVLDSLIESSPKVDKSKLPLIEELIETRLPPVLKRLKSKFVDPSNSIHPEKLEILDYLIGIFPDVQNNYRYEGRTLAQIIEFIIMTDIAIPSKNIDLEFPKSFWHNIDYCRPDGVKNPTMRQNGWDVIEIDSTHPDVEDVKKILKEKKYI